jgi:FkbM family methyltransferase
MREHIPRASRKQFESPSGETVLKFQDGRFARAFLRFASPFANFRRLPVIGPLLRWAGAKLVPRDTLTWIQVQRGPAKGIWLRLNPRTGRDYFSGEAEPEVQALMQKYLLAGMTFYDVGANIGFFSLLAARLVGPTGRVIAFEADPEVAARLREHVARNDGASISVEEKAAWSSAAPVLFARADPSLSPDRGLGHVVAAGATEIPHSAIRVETVVLDEYAAGVRAPDFIKCDVEGAEVDVFRGAQTILTEKKPIILCEMHGEENRQALLREFGGLAYRCEPCGQNHVFAMPSD